MYFVIFIQYTVYCIPKKAAKFKKYVEKRDEKKSVICLKTFVFLLFSACITKLHKMDEVDLERETRSTLNVYLQKNQ